MGELPAEVLEIIQRTIAHLREFGEWPAARPIERDFRKRGRDVQKLLLPHRALVRADQPSAPDEKVKITLEAALTHNEGRKWLEPLPRLYRIAAERYADHVARGLPGPTEVTTADLARLWPSENEARGVAVLLWESVARFGGGSRASAGFKEVFFELGYEVLRFQSVETLDDLLRARAFYPSRSTTGLPKDTALEVLSEVWRRTCGAAEPPDFVRLVVERRDLGFLPPVIYELRDTGYLKESGGRLWLRFEGWLLVTDAERQEDLVRAARALAQVYSDGHDGPVNLELLASRSMIPRDQLLPICRVLETEWWLGGHETPPGATWTLLPSGDVLELLDIRDIDDYKRVRFEHAQERFDPLGGDVPRPTQETAQRVAQARNASGTALNLLAIAADFASGSYGTMNELVAAAKVRDGEAERGLMELGSTGVEARTALAVARQRVQDASPSWGTELRRSVAEAYRAVASLLLKDEDTKRLAGLAWIAHFWLRTSEWPLRTRVVSALGDDVVQSLTKTFGLTSRAQGTTEDRLALSIAGCVAGGLEDALVELVGLVARLAELEQDRVELSQVAADLGFSPEQLRHVTSLLQAVPTGIYTGGSWRSDGTTSLVLSSRRNALIGVRHPAELARRLNRELWRELASLGLVEPDEGASREGLVGADEKHEDTVTSPNWKPTPWAFISCPRGGHEELREAARDACLRAQVLPLGMESWTAEDRSSLEACRARVASCDVVLLIMGFRYGSIEPEAQKSYTELEYNEARKLGKPVLIFASTETPMDPGKTDPEDLARYQEFRKRVQLSLRGDFSNRAELESRVYQALVEWMRVAQAG